MAGPARPRPLRDRAELGSGVVLRSGQRRPSAAFPKEELAGARTGTAFRGIRGGNYGPFAGFPQLPDFPSQTPRVITSRGSWELKSLSLSLSLTERVRLTCIKISEEAKD